MTTKPSRRKQIEGLLLKTGIEIARKGEGALFVLSDHCDYRRLLHQEVKPFSVFEDGATKLLASLAIIDGAVVINSRGMVQDYGAMIKLRKVFRGYGTRHSAACSASLYKNTVAILISQEERKIKIFRQGKLTLQVDPIEKAPKKSVSEMAHMVESIGFGTVASLTVSLAAPHLIGATAVPGLIMFGLPYYVIKKMFEKK